MNKTQWYVLAIYSIILGSFLLLMANPCYYILDGDGLVACYIQRYAHGIPGLILFILALAFFTCAFFEPKKKD